MSTPTRTQTLGTVIGTAVFLLAGFAFGQPPSNTPQIRVTGRAVISTPPDRASIDIGVVSEAPEAQQAARANATKLDAVRSAVLAAAGPGAKLETANYSLQPMHRRPTPPGNEPGISGYTATNVLRVRELPLDAVGKVIDAATASGANTVSNINYSVHNEEDVKSRALAAAATDAKSKADTLADALGVRVLRILNVVEGEPDVIRPMPIVRGEMEAQAAPPPTHIEPNAIEIHASVTLVVEISP
jgi:uncharacterized protein